jgi:hypothetical protein
MTREHITASLLAPIVAAIAAQALESLRTCA